MKCPLCDYEADGVHSPPSDEIVGHLLIDHNLPPTYCVELVKENK